jgi:hypothetical protein
MRKKMNLLEDKLLGKKGNNSLMNSSINLEDKTAFFTKGGNVCASCNSLLDVPTKLT